eukprot:CAMPEP_0195515370 /NCGR_PEP_ID=MMETSP0794_2-20130614/6456_1 /TAXON_ID=515487 /ORGANISM="Stephanopyxis turris, Strain CCMP 815" /LENGTH=352 /DNA_ID=CAMNT_0040643773 /DNA_START=251 /DNA_END=1309 /DNA_ORIENTATION=-
MDSETFMDKLAAAASSTKFELTSGALVLVAANCFAFGTLPNLSIWQMQVLSSIEIGVGVYFLIEYIIRWYIRDWSFSYVIEPLSLLDLVCSLPSILFILVPDQAPSELFGGGLTVLRVLRIARLQRFVRDFESFAQVEMALGLKPSEIKRSQLEFARVFLSLATLLFVSTGLIYAAEHDVNPKLPDFFTALYFGLCTLTTVGFGDIVPVSFNGRLIVSASIIVGITVIPLQVGELAAAILGGDEAEQKNAELKAALERENELLRVAMENEVKWNTRFMLLRDEYIRVMTERTRSKDFDEKLLEEIVEKALRKSAAAKDPSLVEVDDVADAILKALKRKKKRNPKSHDSSTKS